MIKLKEWRDIADEYEDTLVLGNGASIALSSKFSYTSLLERCRAAHLMTPDVDAVFEYVASSDFELVMRMLWHAFNVNKALSIPDDRTENAYTALRHALITTVRETHVTHDVVLPRLETIQQFVGRFATVLSLNYDLILYWAMLAGNESRGGIWFKDCWINGKFDATWERLRQPIGVCKGSTLVFYPHGNLVLATHPSTGEIKIAADRTGANVLDCVVSAWENDNILPMFVSEGETRQKEAAIARHGYLSTVFNEVMRARRDSVVCYGWSFADNDDHILGQLCRLSPNRMAISIYRGGRSDGEIDLECRQIELRIQRHSPMIRTAFFDSASQGCWANP